MPYVSFDAACGSVSFPHLWGKAGMGDSEHAIKYSEQKLLPFQHLNIRTALF